MHYLSHGGLDVASVGGGHSLQRHWVLAADLDLADLRSTASATRPRLG